MAEEVVSQVWDDVYARVGSDLRSVARYGPTTLEVRARDDVEARYTDEETQRIADRTIVAQLGFEDLEATFKAGSLQADLLAFEETWAIICPDGPDQKSGLFVSIQRGDGAGLVDVEWCIEYLTEQTAPRSG